MRRRLATLLSAVLLSTAILLPAVAAPAVAAETTVVLATEASTEGLDPMSPDDEANEFAPADYEANWTWRAGKVLLGAFLIVLLYVGLMYYLRVSRPARNNRS